MEKIIKLNSRGGANNYLKMMMKPDGSESKTYLIKTDMPTLRMGYVDEKNKFIDPSGGPMIVEGSLLEEAKAVVKSIDFIAGYGHTITFE
jgi:hypothetical protein|nr:MAG TPA: hypothetical protein [Caudoviricetes sp.]